MTAATVERLVNRTAPLVPAHGTYPIAANTFLLAGTIACLNASDQLADPAAGFDAVGVIEQTYRNRTTDPSGGAAGAIDGEVSFGLHSFAISGTTPRPRQIVYVVDNQTVSIDPTGGRGIAGVVSEVRTDAGGVSRAYVWMGPHVIAAIRSPRDIDLPLGSFRLASGAAVPAYVDGTNGFVLQDSEAFGIRFNDDVTTVIWQSVKLPEDVPAGAAITLHILAARIGASDAASATFTPSVFANREGVAYDAGAALTTGDFGLLSGSTKVVTELTKTITGAQGGDVLSVSLAAAAGLDDDDAILHAAWISIK